MKRLILVFALAVTSSACSIEATLRARSFQGPYQSQDGADTLSLAQGLIAAGVPDAAIIAALKSRGLNDVEAQQMLLVAGIALKAK